MNDATYLLKDEAIVKLKTLLGQDLRTYAEKYKVNIFKDGKLNKGWAGDTLERFLGLAKNNNQAPNGRYFELKQISLVKRKKGNIVPKETMQITMIDGNHLGPDFLKSHAYYKMKSIVICAILYTSPGGPTVLERVDSFDLDGHETFDQVKADYELISSTLNTQGFGALKSKMGVYIQPRTKGAGHGTISRAFYARTGFLKKVLDL